MMKLMIKKAIVLLLTLAMILLNFSGCVKENHWCDSIEVKSGEMFSVKVSMEESGTIKSMALDLDFSDEDFELVSGNWKSENAIISDFNKVNKDAAIAFQDDTDFHGDIFELSLTAKRDIVVGVGSITVKAVLKNEQREIECKGISLAYSK